MSFYELNSAEDLYCRGFGREEILERIGVDIGYKACNVRRLVQGVDRLEYRMAFVKNTVAYDDFVGFLRSYVAGDMTSVDVFVACGLPGKARIRFDDLCARMGAVDVLAELRAHGVEPTVVLFEKDSPEDLYCRGFSCDDVFRMTGVDVSQGAVRARVRHVNRDAYKKLFVKTMFSREDFVGFLDRLSSGEMFTEDVFVACGLPVKSRISLETLCSLFDLTDELAVARSSVRMAAVDKMQSTMLARYGGKTTLESPQLREKVQATVHDRYGVDHVAQSDVARVSYKATCLEKYGCESHLSAPDVIAKKEATCLARYGSRSSLSNPDVQQKQRDTMVARYGVPFMRQSEELCAKADATMILRYGAAHPYQSEVLRDKCKATMVARHGVEHAGQMPGFMDRVRATCLERYGNEVYLNTEEGRARVVATMRERYGVDNPMQNPEIRAKASATMLARYGVAYSLQCKDIVAKMRASKLSNGTYTASQAEERLYDALVDQFGSSDVFRQYSSDVYPYACDFYVKSRDLYIELNGFVSHGGHWFGSGPCDVDVLHEFCEKHREFTDAIRLTWAERDVFKRETAGKNDLNYVVFWGDQAQDADLWFAMGCPDGRDWEKMYSWLPERDLGYDNTWPEKLDPEGRSVQMAARMANWREFYKRELALWDLNYDGKWGTVQARLYANRLKYLGKTPDQLTDREILRGLNISGMVHAYSIFDNSGMRAFMDAYKPEFIYDPCAGWGERMLTCMASGVAYLGTDINPEIVKAHEVLMFRYHDDASMPSVSVVHGDSAKLDLRQGQQDAVFTCPPYGGREIYTENGAENLSDEDFIAWWRRVVENAIGPNTRVFAYQIDQNWKDRMNQVLADMGWKLDCQISVGKNRVSHMNRKQGKTQKTNFEEVQVFVK